jgi:dipeptidyl aminopeptidase/acylaminoacyl peptidase
MKRFIFISILFLLLSITGHSQTSFEATPNKYSNVDQYLWSFSKNKAIPNQKPLIDFEVMDNWRQVGLYLSISDDGKYFAYTINKPNPSFRYAGMLLNKQDSLIIQSTRHTWRRAFAGTQQGAGTDQGFFSADGKQYIFQNRSNLCFLQLATNTLTEKKEMSSYKTNGKRSWLAYMLKGSDSLILQDLSNGKVTHIARITNYVFSINGERLICQTNDEDLLLVDLTNGNRKRFPSVKSYSFSGNEKTLILNTIDSKGVCLKYVSLPQGEMKTIWSSNGKSKIGKYSVDAFGKQVAFTVIDSENAANAGIWYYEAGLDKAALGIKNQTINIPVSLEFENVSFMDNSHYLHILMKAQSEGALKQDDQIAGLEIWNHKDLKLQSDQQEFINRQKSYSAIVNIANGKVAFVESEDKKILQLQGDFAVIKKDYEDLVGDRFWEKGSDVNDDSTWIIDLRDCSNRLLPLKSDNFWFSPDVKYLVYFDNKNCHYFSYNLNSKVVKDISSNVSENQLGHADVKYGIAPKVGYVAAWINKHARVLVYDNHDIWKLDLTGKQPAVNITNGFGQTNNIVLNLFTTGRSFSYPPSIIDSNELLMLRAYNTQSKMIGFYEKDGIEVGDPKRVYMSDYFISSIDRLQDPNLSSTGRVPMKARNANSWIVQRQSTNDAPNYYETTDFKKYKRLTDFQPQKSYQWLKEELHSFKQIDEITGQGILYKPENFDSNKKYPVLIIFYGAFSNNLYQFHVPTGNFSATSPGKSPLWFLNNGYLVFTPDSYVIPLKHGPSTFNIVEGAARYLKQLPYVDAAKLGCAGHSASSTLAAYIFTHSTSFAATAISESAMYNPISSTLSESIMGPLFLNQELSHGNLWKNKDSWLDYTAVLQADQAKGALLLFANKESEPLYQNAALQFFNACRRLNKNVWWLKYDKGEHTLNDPIEMKDYTIRYTQFFDHYLKNAPAPQWMTQGVPYKYKGIESRYELDAQGTCNAHNGEPCSICEAWNKQKNRTPEMFQKEIKDWALDKDIADELEMKLNERRKQLDKEGEVRTKDVMKMLGK